MKSSQYLCRPRPVVPPKPVISRELVQNLINSAAAANPPSHSSKYFRNGATVASSRSLENLLSDNPAPQIRSDRHVSALFSAVENITPPTALEASFVEPSWAQRRRPLSGNAVAGSSDRSATFPVARERSVSTNCDNNDEEARQSDRTDLVIESVRFPPRTSIGGYQRSRSLHHLNRLSPPTASSAFQTER
jgi:hypothetical protein